MTNSLHFLIIIALYAGLSALVAWQLVQKDVTGGIKVTMTHISVSALLTWLAHGLIAYQLLDLLPSLSAMIVITSCILVGTFLALTIFMPITSMAVIVFPVTLTCLLFAFTWPHADKTVTISDQNSVLNTHIIVALLAYSFITIGTFQALLFKWQEHQYRNFSQPRIIESLPPLETMETLVFRLLIVGFVLLSITLISGMLFSHALFATSFELNHHNVLAIFAWIILSAVLAARYVFSMRGSNIIVWAVMSFICMQLGYFGTKIILELTQ